MALIRGVAIGLFPLLLGVFAALYALDPDTYRRVLEEDGAVENITVVFLFLAATLALVRAWRVSRRGRLHLWFYVVFAAGCLTVAGEEMSWGQRILDFASPQFFIEHGRQAETNVHNVVERWTKLTTKDFLAAACLLYGIGLPILASRSRRVRRLAGRLGPLVPPLFLVPGFAFTALLQFDYPTGREEEIGEMFLSLCASLIMLDDIVGPAHARSAFGDGPCPGAT